MLGSASTLDKVRGEAIEDDEAECKNGNDEKPKKKKMDFYDPSILASPNAVNDELQQEQNRLLFEEVIDLARGGIGGQYTGKLNRKKKRKHRKRKGQQSRSKRKKKADQSKSMKIHKPPQKRRTRKRKRERNGVGVGDGAKENDSETKRISMRSSSLNSLPVSPHALRKKSRSANDQSPDHQRKKRKMVVVPTKTRYSTLLSMPPPPNTNRKRGVLIEEDETISNAPRPPTVASSHLTIGRGNKNKSQPIKKRTKQIGCKTQISSTSIHESGPLTESKCLSERSKKSELCTEDGMQCDFKLKATAKEKAAEKRKRAKTRKRHPNSLCELFNQ